MDLMNTYDKFKINGYKVLLVCFPRERTEDLFSSIQEEPKKSKPNYCLREWFLLNACFRVKTDRKVFPDN